MLTRNNYEMMQKVIKWSRYLKNNGKATPREVGGMIPYLSMKDKVALAACLRQAVYNNASFALLFCGIPAEQLKRGAYYRVAPLADIMDACKRADAQLVYTHKWTFVVHSYTKGTDIVCTVDMRTGQLLEEYPVIHYEDGAVRDRDDSIL